MTLGLIILIIVAVIIMLTVVYYNKFIRLRTQAGEAWSDIDVQLKRRYDLIPNLIDTVKGYADHESKTLERVTEMRNIAMNAGNPAESAQAENMLSESLKSLFAVSENYPDLKANENFIELQKELTDTENKIQASRRFYNTTVRDLNVAIESVPSNIIANMFKFTKREFFDLSDSPEEREVVKVDFGKEEEK
jgi:LemA protein